MISFCLGITLSLFYQIPAEIARKKSNLCFNRNADTHLETAALGGLDERIDLRAQDVLTFVRLTMLAGGGW